MDIPPGLWLSVFVGMMVVGVVVAVGAHQTGGTKIAAVVGAWFAVDVALGAAGVFAAEPNTTVPIIGLGIVLPIAVGTWLLTRPGSLATVAERLPLPWLVGVQLFRAIGVLFLVAWALDLMPAVFALPAGIGDVAVGLAAPFVARRLERDPVGGRRMAVAWNVAGIADLVLAVTLGFLSSPSAFQLLSKADPNALVSRMPFVLIPVFGVPIAIVLHIVALRRLSAPEDSHAAALTARR